MRMTKTVLYEDYPSPSESRDEFYARFKAKVETISDKYLGTADDSGTLVCRGYMVMKNIIFERKTGIGKILVDYLYY